MRSFSQRGPAFWGAAIMTAGISLWAGTAGAGQKVTGKTEGGQVIIRNPKEPVPRPGGPSRLILKEELVLGAEAGAEGPLFADLRSVGVDGRENVWTLDWTDIKVRVFDKTGKLISTFGRKGQGPKELQSPQRMVVSGDGKAYILDTNKVAVYALDGTCLDEYSMARLQPFRLKVGPGGFIYVDSWDFAPERIAFKLNKLDGKAELLATYSLGEERFPKPGTPGLFTAILYFHPMRNGHVIWGVSSRYQFHELDADGKPVRTILKDYAPRKISASEGKKLIKERFGDRAAGIRVEVPDAYPPIQYFMGDDEDRLYARTYDQDGRGGLWYDVFDSQGRCFTRFSLPEEEMLFIVLKNKAYTIINENEEGLPLVKRYAMEWR
jgi:hypothetical protein